MFKSKSFLCSVLEIDPGKERLFTVKGISEAVTDQGDVTFSASLVRKIPHRELLYFEADEPSDVHLFFRVRFYSSDIVRMLISRVPVDFEDNSPMLVWDPAIQQQPASLNVTDSLTTARGGPLAFSASGPGFSAAFSLGEMIGLRFQSQDHFVETLWDSLPVYYLHREDASSMIGFVIEIASGEHFCGAGERFARPDLAGQQIDLYNVDAAGVNNSRAYKNIPFLLSSRGYGIFVHSSAYMRLDIGAQSTRALQWLVEDDKADIFFIGGSTPERVLFNYRRLTGFPAMPPDWSFGVWMSRCTYTSAAEVEQVARRLRSDGYPADVLHLDTGWFAKDWFCDWKFSPETFPDPAGMLKRLNEQGFRLSLWQYPYIRPEIDLAEEALREGYVGKETPDSHRHWLGYTIDFTKRQAVQWYQSLLTPLLRIGASVIKTDFGEQIDEGAQYESMDARKYHNLFALLYQKAAWEATIREKGAGDTIIWARSSWAGSQRYPVHWGGDAAATFDGLAGTIRGGLHLGLSGFAFWSHDVGGIHGIPVFATSRPSDDLYVRWTQVGVFSSHIRYHGGTPREPWEFPAVSGIVRDWLRFRYSLLPYIIEQSQICTRSGYSLLRSLVFDWPSDPAAWVLDDEYLFGESFLVCPVLHPSGVRGVYLPKSTWVDFWSGEMIPGPFHFEVQSPLSRLPLFVRFGSKITFAEPVEHTKLLDKAKRVTLRFDDSYRGFDTSPLSEWYRFDEPNSA